MDDPIKYDVESDCEEESFCNCENNEQITPYLRDDCDCFDRAAEAVADRCNQIKSGCEDKLKALKKGRKNPYFKQTWILQTDIYKSMNDDTPCDRVVMKNSYALSLRALALIGGAVGAIWLVKKMLDEIDEH